MVDVSICILTWNSTTFLCDNLDSIFRYIKNIEFEVIVVDNGSKDNVAENLKERFPSVKFIRNNINRGVAAARNQCLKRSIGNFILLLDSDVSFKYNFLDVLLMKMKEGPDIALAGPRIIYPNGALQYSCREFPNLLAIMLHGFGLDKLKLFSRNIFLRNYLMLDTDHQKTQEVDWVFGACQLIRREALSDVGMFDEAYFFIYEDIDFCRRLKSKGWKIMYLPEAEIMHHHQRISARGINKFTFLHIWSILYYFIKNGILKRLTKFLSG